MKFAIVFEISEIKEVIDDELDRLRTEGDIPLECLEEGGFILNNILKVVGYNLLLLVKERHISDTSDVDPWTAEAFYKLLIILGSFGIDNDCIDNLEVLSDKASIRLILDI